MLFYLIDMLLFFICTFNMHSSTWLWNIARGISGEEVQARLLPKSHGSGKSFPGPRALKTVASVRFIIYTTQFFFLKKSMLYSSRGCA